MSVALILASSVVFLGLCFLARRYGRVLYLTFKIPGPSIWYSLFVLTKELFSDRIHHQVQEISTAFNNRPWGTWTMRGYILFVSDRESVEEVFKSKSLVNKSNVIYDQLAFYLGRGLLSLNGEEHKYHRKLFQPIFRKSVVHSYLDQMNVVANQLTEKLRQVANDKYVDTRSTIGEHVGMMSVYLICQDHFPVQSVLKLLRLTSLSRNEIMLEAFHPVYYYLWHRLKRATRELEKAIRQAFDERCRLFSELVAVVEKNKFYYNGMTPTCALDVLATEITRRGAFGVEEAIAEGTTLIAASHDTTTFVLNACLVVIALHPEVQERICEEIDAIFNGSLRPVQDEDLTHLKYLEMAVKEVLRLFPGAPIIGRKAEHDVVIQGVTVPKGSTVMINIFSLHRNPEIYEDPLKYDPTRFSSENSTGRSSYAYIPFSSGSRNCIGQDAAWMMLKTFLCYIFREFQVLPGADIKGMDDIKPAMHITFDLPKYPLKFVKRNTQ